MYARSGQKKYNKLCPWKKDTEIRRERKILEDWTLERAYMREK